MPLGLSTRVVGAGDDLTAALGRVARDASQIVVVEPTVEPEPEDEAVDRGRGADRRAGRGDAIVASPTPAALRESTSARRSEVRRDVEERVEDDESGRELRRPGRVSLVEETQVVGRPGASHRASR